MTSRISPDKRRSPWGWILLWMLGIPIPVLFALFLLRHDANARAPIPNDAATLCAPYGGVREVGSRTYTVKANGVEETAISAYCNDGSYVSRFSTGKP